MTDYVSTTKAEPPQLSREDLQKLTPDEIVKADALGQLAALREGRKPGGNDDE